MPFADFGNLWAMNPGTQQMLSSYHLPPSYYWTLIKSVNNAGLLSENYFRNVSLTLWILGVVDGNPTPQSYRAFALSCVVSLVLTFTVRVGAKCLIWIFQSTFTVLWSAGETNNRVARLCMLKSIPRGVFQSFKWENLGNLLKRHWHWTLIIPV